MLKNPWIGTIIGAICGGIVSIALFDGGWVMGFICGTVGASVVGGLQRFLLYVKEEM